MSPGLLSSSPVASLMLSPSKSHIRHLGGDPKTKIQE